MDEVDEDLAKMNEFSSANLSIVFPGIEMEIADVHMWDTPLEGNSLSLTLIYIIHEII